MCMKTGFARQREKPTRKSRSDETSEQYSSDICTLRVDSCIINGQALSMVRRTISELSAELACGTKV